MFTSRTGSFYIYLRIPFPIITIGRSKRVKEEDPRPDIRLVLTEADNREKLISESKNRLKLRNL